MVSSLSSSLEKISWGQKQWYKHCFKVTWFKASSVLQAHLKKKILPGSIVDILSHGWQKERKDTVLRSCLILSCSWHNQEKQGTPNNFMPLISLMVAEENKSDSWSLTHSQISNFSKQHRIHKFTYYWTKQLKNTQTFSTLPISEELIILFWFFDCKKY